MEVTQEQVNAYVGALVEAGIDPASFGEFMVRSKLFMELRELETGLDILARQRAEALGAFDAQEVQLRTLIDAKRTQIESLAG